MCDVGASAVIKNTEVIFIDVIFEGSSFSVGVVGPPCVAIGVYIPHDEVVCAVL